MECMSIWMEGLTPAMIEKAEQELGETPTVKEEAVKALRRLLKEKANFHPPLDDASLIRFLRARKYDVVKTFRMMQNYYAFTAKYKGLYAGFTPMDLKHILDMNGMLLLPKRLPSGEAIGVYRTGCIDIDQVTPAEQFAGTILCAELTGESEATQVCGMIWLMDWGGMDIKMFRYLASPTLIARFFHSVQNCMPLRLKAIHIVNEPRIFSMIFSICKVFMSEKLKSRIMFHGNNFESLQQYIPPEILPEEYGGKDGPISAKEFCKRLLSRDAEYRERLRNYGLINKEKRVLQTKTNSDNNI